MDLQVGDIVYFKNGKTGTLNEFALAIIELHYADDLTCLVDDNFTIIKIVRPVYEIIYEREKIK